MGLTKRQDEIVEASMRIIAKSGIESLTTKSIAKSVGISEAAIYRHFKSKSDILLSVLEYFENRASGLLNLVSKENICGLDKIYRILKTRCDDFVDNPALMVVIFSEELFPNDSRLSNKVYEIMSMNQRVITEIIDGCINSGEVRNDIGKDILFYMIAGTFRFMVTHWRLSNYGTNLKDDFKSFWEALTKLIKKY